MIFCRLNSILTVSIMTGLLCHFTEKKNSFGGSVESAELLDKFSLTTTAGCNFGLLYQYCILSRPPSCFYYYQ